LGVLLETEIRGISEVQEVKNHGRETEREKVKFSRSDNKGEYTSTKFKAYMVDEV